MIIKDDQGEILLDSRVTNLLIDQNGNHWKLSDEIDGLALEMINDPSWTNIAVVALGPNVVKLKPEQVRRRNGT